MITRFIDLSELLLLLDKKVVTAKEKGKKIDSKYSRTQFTGADPVLFVFLDNRYPVVYNNYFRVRFKSGSPTLMGKGMARYEFPSLYDDEIPVHCYGEGYASKYHLHEVISIDVLDLEIERLFKKECEIVWTQESGCLDSHAIYDREIIDIHPQAEKLAKIYNSFILREDIFSIRSELL